MKPLVSDAVNSSYGTSFGYKDAVINSLQVSAYKIPTDAPEADGTLNWDSTSLVVVQLEAGDKTGLGYTYADEASAFFIHKKLKDLVTRANPFDIPSITTNLIKHIRNSGTCGIAMMAISAIDNALWDLKAKLYNVPLFKLLGAVRNEMLIYGSGGFTSYNKQQLQQQLGDWAAQGIGYVKMKIGTEPNKDLERVQQAKEVIGNAQLMVDANGAYTAKQALDKAQQFTGYGVMWFEEPVSSDNLEGLHFIREHAPAQMNIAAGEYGYNLPYFEAMLHAKAVDVLQADATRCGGISGFLKAGYLAEAHQLPFSSHCAPALHLQAALSLPSFFIAEYFHDHARIENMLFDGIPPPINGVLKPDLNRPGLGFEFKFQDAEKYKL
ncbi:enolase C-terminal domain-like protein [Segetibacter koreensis]|uniref:enolase C-terminal domain-like protein n=1 Tax=Segetibacter koreensis TaxID=398037 RepID=UPI00037F9FEF|nr:enolase C-terminal domain-like protein [Segetibacter koreensis]